MLFFAASIIEIVKSTKFLKRYVKIKADTRRKHRENHEKLPKILKYKKKLLWQYIKGIFTMFGVYSQQTQQENFK